MYVLLSPLKTLRELYSELMGWEGEELMPVDFVMASYLSGFLPGAVEKAWGDLCGPPAIGKTEILRSLEDGQQRTVVIDHITENAFASAFRDEENPDKDLSLAFQLSNGRPPIGPKVLILPDLSTYLTMKSEKINKFFGDLRAAFSGCHNTASGNLVIQSRNDLGFGLLTACTEVLDEFRKVNQSLGERTVVCRIGKETCAYEARQKIADHVGRISRVQKHHLQVRIRTTTRKAMDTSIAYIKKVGGKVEMSEEFFHKVGRLATAATSVRTQPISQHSFVSLAEGPGRLKQQLITWGDSRVLFDSRTSWTSEDYNLVRRIAQDTMHPESLRAMRVLWRGGIRQATMPMEADDIRKGAKIDGSFFRQLQQWSIIGILTQFGPGSYGLNHSFAQDIHDTGFMEGL